MDEVLTGAISSLHKKKLPCFSSVNNAKGGLLWGGSFEKEKKGKRNDLRKNINKFGCSLLNLAWLDILKLENNAEIQTHSVQGGSSTALLKGLTNQVQTQVEPWKPCISF